MRAHTHTISLCLQDGRYLRLRSLDTHYRHKPQGFLTILISLFL
uniref:Uncharacterized protein n=1 Tax=Rhizophora mucronata TaxID=61149 RepID=A0A2P2QX02_RHIMU